MASELFPNRNHIVTLCRYAIPIVTVQLGVNLMGAVDALMVGRLSATELAAVALGHLYFMTISSFGSGTLLALDTVISQAVGSQQQEPVRLGIQRGLLIAVPLSLVTGLLLLPSENLFIFLRQPTDAVPLASNYAMASIAGVLPLYVFLVLRQSLQCLGSFSPIVWAVIIGNLANIFLNWIFVFGHFGAPEMGAVGAGWTTAVGRWVMAFVVLNRGWSWLETHLISFNKEVFNRLAILRIFQIGCPIGIQVTLEYGVFAVIGLLVGLLGTVAMASHQIAISLASLTFMIAVGIAQATTVLVGKSVGSRNTLMAKRFAGAGLLNVVVVMTGTALMFFFLPEFLASLYSDDIAVVALATILIPIAGIFQIVDGLQAVSSGILRGVGDTLVPMLINLVGFWFIGLPVSAYLGFRLEMATVGLWWGMVVALGVVCLCLVLRVKKHFLNEKG